MSKWPNFIMGFRPGFQLLMMIDTFRMTLYKSAEWGRPICVGQTDVEAGLESMDHADVIQGWRQMDVTVVLIAAMYREMLGTSVDVVIGGHRCEPDEVLDMIEGGRPGDVATPRHWNSVLVLVLDPLLQSWRQQGFGMRRCYCSTGRTILFSPLLRSSSCPQ